MSHETPDKITLEMMRSSFYSAVVSDALDALGYSRQSPRVSLAPLTTERVLVGYCKTTLWEELQGKDSSPYELELQAVDECQPDDVLIAAAAGSMRSGIWGELLSTAAGNRGCIGAIVDGAVRDVEKMTAMGFAVFARGTSVYDSQDRQRVSAIDVPVEIDGVRFSSGDLVIADRDGVVVVPAEVHEQAVQAALDGNMDLINGIDDRVQRAKAKSALAKAKRNR